MLVAFSLALASSSWFPPVGSGMTLILLIVGLRLFYNPDWLGPTVWGAVVGAVAFVVLWVAGASASGESIIQTRYSESRQWMSAARRYAIPIGGIAGGAVGHALYVWNDRRKREGEAADDGPDDPHAA